ncbi:MAG: phosphatidylserine decarboxylase [Candidatus Hydrogenedentota bacterium]
MKKPFNAWKEGARYYAPVLAAGIVLTGVLYPVGFAWVGAVVVVAGVAMMLFFRDFPRVVPAGAGVVAAPADGKVVGIEALEETPHYDGPCMCISIFLSIFDVHVNRAPYACTVREITYAPGAFKAAMRPEAGVVNESNTLRLDTDAGPMTVRQISGAVARRIVCPVRVGDQLERGEKFGMIRYGSRTELYLPPDAEVCVTLKAKIRAGATIVARVAV